MKNRPGRQKRQFSKKSTSLTVEFLERRVVLNADPTGGVLITGSPIEGQALTASNNIVDADGLGPISYQWKSASNPIPDATSPTYVLQDSDVGTVISVVATYTDLLGTEEVVSSQPTVVIESSSPLARQSSTVSYSPDYTSINGRTFGYYVPESYDPSTPTPLLFMFHGMGGDSSEQSGGSAENSYYGWQTTAHQNGFIVLFPESLGYFKTWDLGGGGSSSDLSFVDDMIGWASTNYNISQSQIFTTGHSWGAYFSYYVATFRSDDIAAFGAHSGGLGGAFFLGSTPSVPSGPSPTPALNGIVLHAVDDGIVPYSNSQNLYDDLVANGHNVYDDGIGADGIIEVDGWGPDNHRYRKQHNQTQWDFFLSVAPNPVTSNQPPEFNQPLDLVLNEDALLQSIALTGISSGDGVQQPVRVTATSSNPGLIPDPTVSYTNSSATGSLVVAPVANQHGISTITVTVEDGGLDNNLETADDNAIVSQAFEVTVTSVNDPGFFSGDTLVTGSEDDSAITGTLIFTDAIDGDSVPNYTITSESNNGTASIDATTGTWSFTPNANFNGPDFFTVTVTDDEGHTETQVVSLIVASVNDPGSFTGNTTATGSEDDSAITGTLTFTDAVDGDSLPNYAITSESSNGTAFIDAATGIWLYTPNANFNGLDSFTVTVTDDDGYTETQVINLIVASVNDTGSFSGNTSVTGTEDDSAITGTLVFTDSIDGDSVPNYTITSESNNGTASINATTGAWSYTPSANFNGSDSFTVTVTDDDGYTETHVINLIVEAVNDPGSFSGDTSVTGSEDDSAITGTLIFTDAIDGDSVPNYTITSESSNGTASIDATTGAWSYTPNANFNGSDSFTVTVTDDDGYTETQVVSLIVEAVNDAPTLDVLSGVSANEDDGEKTVNLTGISAGDGEAQPLLITAVSDSTGLIPDPTVTYSSPGSTGTLVFTPVPNQNGTATITVTVVDGGFDNDLTTPDDNGTTSRTVSVAVAPVNDRPTLDALSNVMVNEGDPEQAVNLIGMSTGGSETQVLSVTAVSGNAGLIPDPVVDLDGQSSTGTLKFTPVVDQFGTATITVTVEDGGLDNLLETTGDNAIVSQTFEVTVLETLSYEGLLPLSRNAAGNLYVNKEPVFMGAENAQANIRGFQVLGADDAGGQKSLLVRRDNHVGNSVRCRVLTDDVWRISCMFDSLTNETNQSMNASARDVVYEFPASVLPGTTIGNLPSQYETSGLTWHDGLQKLFAVSDEGIVSMMNADGSDIVNWNVPGDLEALTVADHTSDLIYIGVENPDSILEFDVSTGQVTRTFDLTDWMTGADNRGLEALAFVPDATHPEGGLFFAGLQSDGRIYQFAVPIVSSSFSTAVTFVQSMAIEGGSTDLAGLAYDPSSGLLLAMFDSLDQLNVIDRDGQLRSRWTVPGVGQEAVILVDGQFYVGDDSLFSITLYAGFDLLTA